MPSARRWLRGTVVAGLAVCCSTLTLGNASAAPLFTVNEGVVPGAVPNLVIGDRLTYSFATEGTQTFGGADLTGNDDPFTEVGSVHVQSIQNGVLTPPQELTPQQPSAFLPEPGPFYGMYAVFTGSGESEPLGSATDGSTGILGIFTSFDIQLYLDPLRDTDIDTTIGVRAGGTADDIQIAFGTLAPAANCPADPTCGISRSFPPNVAQGDFAVLARFFLTDAGADYFITPDPFYGTIRVTGVSSLLTPISGTETRNEGAGNAFFGTPVPEPATLLILGAGLVGVALAGYRRRR